MTALRGSSLKTCIRCSPRFSELTSPACSRSELGNLSNLEILELRNNELTGEFPPELGKLVNLRTLTFFSSELSGEMPPEPGRLARLRSIVLGGNQLSGAIPAEIGYIASLEILQLDRNDLSGALPAELGSSLFVSVLTTRFLGQSGCQRAGGVSVEFPPIIPIGNSKLRLKVPGPLVWLLHSRCGLPDAQVDWQPRLVPRPVRRLP